MDSGESLDPARGCFRPRLRLELVFKISRFCCCTSMKHSCSLSLRAYVTEASAAYSKLWIYYDLRKLLRAADATARDNEGPVSILIYPGGSSSC